MIIAGLLLALSLVPAALAQGNAKVRVVHASPDAPAVDVYAGALLLGAWRCGAGRINPQGNCGD